MKKEEIIRENTKKISPHYDNFDGLFSIWWEYKILNHHMIYDNSSTHNLKQITRKTKIIVESLLQLIPIKTCQNGAKSVKHYSFFSN